MIVEYGAKNSFEKNLAKGEVVFSDRVIDRYPTLYVPIVDVVTSRTVTYAEMLWYIDRYFVYWIDLQGDLISQESLDAQLGIESSYVLLNFDREKFVYAYANNGFYRYNSILSICDGGNCYTADEVSSYLDGEMRRGPKMFLGMVLPGVLYFLITFILVPIIALALLIGAVAALIALLMFLHRRKKEKRASQNNGFSSEH